MNTFADYLKKVGITGYKLSQLTGLSPSTVSDLITGKTDINRTSWITIRKVCKALDITPTELHDYLHTRKST